MSSILLKLAAIQQELKAPKTQFNKFGGYSYRKCEDILEAAKPILAKYKCILTCSDELVQQGDRHYIKATVTLMSAEDGNMIQTTAYAREEEEKKGMDGSQVTGASSSYARKYALNGLFCIDDTADSDTTNQGDDKAPQKAAGGAAPSKPTKTSTAPSKAPEKKEIGKQDLLPGGRTYKASVAAHAKGQKAKDGGSIREAWAKAVKASEDLLEAFDHDVATYRMENNIQGVFEQ